MAVYDKLIAELCGQYSKAEIIENCRALNQTYNIYDPNFIQWQKLRGTFEKSNDILSQLEKIVPANQIINDLFMHNYQCERIIKYFLLKKLMNLKENIVAFEMSIGPSRIDICRINGHTYAYEIKTEYDTFNRLHTQLPSYQQAFDYVYIVTPLKRAKILKDMVPLNCGLIAYTIRNNTCKFSYLKKAERNKCDLSFCLQSCSSQELSFFIKHLSKHEIPTLREEKEKLAFALSTKKGAWKAYRDILKKRYSKKWQFIVQNRDQILPIDMQEFFSSLVSPDDIYKSS